MLTVTGLRVGRLFGLCLLASVCVACSNSESPPGALPNVDWPLHGNDWKEQRHSPLDQINRDSVKTLGLAWHFDMVTRRGVEATPLVIDGVMYVSGSWGTVYALDGRSGKMLWFYDPKVDKATLAKGCCDAVNRGVAFHDNKVIVGAYDGRLIALDAADGSVVWSVATTDPTKPYTITGAPRIAGDKVVIGNGGADLGVRGYVSAYSVSSGKLAWRFYTVPGDPSKGFESSVMEGAAKTWTGEWWKWGGGGTVWDSIVYDPELDLLYIGVGNGSPRNQQLRSPGGGDNLFLASIVALRPDTGEYVWHYQTVPGETWDYTATQPMMLAELEIDGRQRSVLMQAPKPGFFYVLDRISGELISAEKYTQVTWAIGVDMKTGRPIENPAARDFDNPVPVFPFLGGGHNWTPMSYNPVTGLVYFAEMSVASVYQTPTRAIDIEPGFGFNNGYDSLAAALPPLPNIEEIIRSTSSGKLLAWDPVKQSARWQIEFDDISFHGTLSTAGMLVFQGDMKNRFSAMDAETGEVLWRTDVQSAANAGPISYAIDGVQYIAVTTGFGGGGGHEGGPLGHFDHNQNKSRVLVFKLGGEDSLPPMPVVDTAFKKPLPVTADAKTVLQGQILYERYCSSCHGSGLLTGGLNPDLRRSGAAVHQQWQNIVIGGALRSLGMVSFKEAMDASGAEAIRQYVLSEANRVYALQEGAK